MEDNYFRNFSSSGDDFSHEEYPLQDIDEAFKSLLEIEYNDEWKIRHVYTDDITYSIKIHTKDKTLSYNSQEGGSEYLIYLLLAFYERQKQHRDGADTPGEQE